MTTVKTIPKNIDQNAQGKAQEVDTLHQAKIQARKAEILAKKAEDQSESIRTQAEMAETLAKKAEQEAKAYVHKATVEAELAKEYRKKAETKNEVMSKCRDAEAIASLKNSQAIAKNEEVIAKAQPCRTIAAAKRAEAKLAKSENKTINGKVKVEAREAEAKAYAIESEANKAKAEARKAESELKKIKLELEQVIEAEVLKDKHAAAAVWAESQAKIKKTEADDRMAEAEARRAQSVAKKAEAKAIRSNDMAAAESWRREAQIHKATAIDQQALIKKKQLQKKAIDKKTPNELQPPQSKVNLLPNKRTRFAEKKHLSATGLLSTVHEVFRGIPDQKRGNQGGESEIKLSDCLMSGLAVFSLKYPSLLQFDRDSRENACIKHNLHTLYKIDEIPSDTYIRERLDVIDPAYLRPAFKKLFANFQRGKELEEYVFLDGHYLVAGDGTGSFSSKNVSCINCCVKHHRDGSITYYHQAMSAAIVNPDYATVIPFCPEPIINTDGSTKNDCERKASERLYRHIRREHPHLPIIVTEDALGSNGPHIRLLKEVNMRYIIVVKPDGNKSIFEFLKGIKREEYLHNDGEFSYKIQYVNDIPLNDSHTDLNVNFLEAWVYDKTGNLEYHNTWITDIPITKSNVYRLYQGGRAKWKIENETFNTLKNQDYHFERNFGHGYKNLSTVFMLLMFLAFLIDQIQQSCCGLFQAAWQEMKSKTRLWRHMQAYCLTTFIDSWEQLWQKILCGIQKGSLMPIKQVLDTS